MSDITRTTAGDRTLRLVTVAIMIALVFIFSRFLGVNTDVLHLGLDFLPIVIIAYLYGPLWSAIAYIIGDLVCAIGMPIGVLNPGITLMAGLVGFTYGLVFYKRDMEGKKLFLRTLLAAGIVAFGIKLFGTTACLSVAYGSPYWGLLISRLLNCAILFAVQLITIPLIYKLVVCKLPQRLPR